MAVGENHELGALAALRLADAFTPFFPAQNVPSANDSARWMRPLRSSARNNRDQAFSHTPDSVHAFKRRQHVAGEGKCLGKSCHRDPVRKTQRMPSTQGRAGITGRPPSGPTDVSGNKSAIKSQCFSDNSHLGSILDPVGDAVASRDRSLISSLLSADYSTNQTNPWFSENPGL
jgi:hypothetical protein